MKISRALIATVPPNSIARVSKPSLALALEPSLRSISTDRSALGDAGLVLRDTKLATTPRDFEHAERTVRVGPRSEGSTRMVTTAVALVQGVVTRLFEAGMQFFRGLSRIFTGDIGGVRDVGRALVGGLVQTPVDVLLLAGGQSLSAVQTAFGLEPTGRELSPAEVSTLSRIFGDAIDYGRVRLKEGPSGLFDASRRPFTLGNTIYVKRAQVTPDLLVHEMAHVWQFQNGGPRYMSEALVGQWFGHAYAWEESWPKIAFTELEPEQQAELLEDAQRAGYFDTAGERGSSPRFIHRGIDYTQALEAALACVRAGQGAP